MPLTNQELFAKERLSDFKPDASLVSFVFEQKENVGPIDDVDQVMVDHFLENFLKLAKKKWNQANSRAREMEKKFGYPGGWLDQAATLQDSSLATTSATTPVTTPVTTPSVTPSATPSATPSVTPSATPTTTPSKKRKTKEFSELSRSQKNRSTAELRAANDTEKLLHAAQVSLKTSGQSDLATVIDEANSSPSRAAKFRRLSGAAESLEKVPRKDVKLPVKISSEDGLVHLFYTDMPEEAYTSTRLTSKAQNADIWPSYKNVLAAKQHCRPENISFEETEVIVPLSERLRHNDARLMKMHEAKFQELLQAVPEGGVLEVDVDDKIGFDGSTGNSIYNQKFSLENRDATDSSLLSTCLVPLQYRAGEEVIFTNPVPQGSAFCQPVRLEYKKETVQNSQAIGKWIEDGEKELKEKPIVFTIGSKSIKFNHTLYKTMMDVKAKMALTDTQSSLRCFVCGATSSHLNNIATLATDFPSKEESLEYSGICDLHAWLRCFDAINSLSDKLCIKKWKAVKKQDKDKVEESKKLRQQKFKDELDLLVDVPRGSGAGNSNTGNVARRAFQNEEAFARITGVDQTLIHRIHVMLILINTDKPIKREEFKAYGLATANLWVELYGWYYMPVTVHQLFFHAWESLALSSLPLSFFSEQSLETCNKHFKRDRERHTRKDSRLHTIQDQFHRQSDKSDIIIATKLIAKRRCIKKEELLPQDVMELLDVVEESEADD